MLHTAFNKKGQTVLSEMKDYLLESGLQNCANAFDKAIGEVVAYETEGTYRNLFSKKVNRIYNIFFDDYLQNQRNIV